MRIVIETLDTVREVNRWEIADTLALIPDWHQLGDQERVDRLAEAIGDGAELCKNLEGETLERELIEYDVDDRGDAK